MRNAWRDLAAFVVWILWIIAFGPFWLWLACAIEAVFRRIGTGRWPMHAWPPPAETATLSRFINLAPWFAALLIGIASVVAWFLTARYSLGRRFLLVAAGIVVLWAGAYLLMVVDPGGILNWALD
jgi:hypothetical protein